EAERLVETEAQRARLLITQGRLCYISGRWRNGIEPNREACRVARTLGAHDLEAEALGGLADAEYAVGDMRRAEAHVRAAIDAAIDAAGASGDAAHAPAQHALLTHVMIYNGRLEEGASLARNTVALSRKTSDWRAEINAQLGIASAAFCGDALDLCRAAAERVAELSARARADRFTFVSGLYQARVAIAQGRLDRARAVLDDMAALSEVRDGPIHAPQFGLLRALTAEDDDVLADRLAQAETHLSGTVAHNALRVLPVAALLWRLLGDARRMRRSMQALRDLAEPDRASWASIMQGAVASIEEGDVDAAAVRVARQGFRRMSDAMQPGAHPPSVMLVC
ncbi:MAG: hypothetical protein AAFU61_10995, partial [Pseudomonadota bacterium]